MNVVLKALACILRERWLSAVASGFTGVQTVPSTDTLALIETLSLFDRTEGQAYATCLIRNLCRSLYEDSLTQVGGRLSSAVERKHEEIRSRMRDEILERRLTKDQSVDVWCPQGNTNYQTLSWAKKIVEAALPIAKWSKEGNLWTATVDADILAYTLELELRASSRGRDLSVGYKIICELPARRFGSPAFGPRERLVMDACTSESVLDVKEVLECMCRDFRSIAFSLSTLIEK